jgi:hypothetical protein
MTLPARILSPIRQENEELQKGRTTPSNIPTPRYSHKGQPLFPSQLQPPVLHP